MDKRILVSLIFITSTQWIDARADNVIPTQWKTAVDAGVVTLQNAKLFQAGEIGYLQNGVTAIWNYGGSSESSIFEIGSTSKSFTGIMLAEQIIEGKVTLSDTVSKHFPEFKGTFVGGITLQQLALHTSGLPRMPCDDVSKSYCFHPKDPLNPYVDYTWPDLKAYLLQYAPAGYDPSQPRPAQYPYEYSNTGTALLGQLLAKKDCSTFDEMLARRVSIPLGLKDTSVELNSEQKTRFLDGYDITSAVTPHWDFNVMAPAGAIHSTATDMMKYLSANLDPESLLSHPGTENLALAMILSHEEGLCWDSKPGAEVTFKNGETGGFASWILFSKQNEVGYFIIANQADSPNTGTLLNLPFGQSLPDVMGLPLTSNQLQKLVGNYVCPQLGQIQISVDGNFLKFYAPAGELATLRATSETEFNLIDGVYPDAWYRISFAESATGEITGATFHSKDDNGNPNPDIACSIQSQKASTIK